MRILVLAVGLVAFTSVGCGSQTQNTAPLTDEQKAKVKAEDRLIEEDERSGSGQATRSKKR